MRKQNLNLMTCLAFVLILMMAFSFISAGFFTGKAVDYSTKLYQGNERKIPGTSDTIKVVSANANSAIVSINGETIEVKKGATENFNGYSVYVRDIGKLFTRYWARVQVRELSENTKESSNYEKEESEINNFFIGHAYKPAEIKLVPADKKRFSGRFDYGTLRIGGVSIEYISIIFHGSNWDCGVYSNKGLSQYAYTSPNNLKGAQPSEYSDSDVRGLDNSYCVYLNEHPETKQPEFVVSTSSSLNGKEIIPSEDISIEMEYFKEGIRQGQDMLTFPSQAI